MPNLNNPFGLLPLYVLSGGPIQTEEFSKVVGYATALFAHDAINRVADGSIEASATPGTTLYSGVNLNYGAALTATTHLAVVGPDTVFTAQGDGTGTLAAVDEGLNANLVLTAGNTLTRQSKHQIAESTKAITGTLDVKLLKLLVKPDNDYGANARFEILINRHRMALGVAGV
jgi:hypothetical protein